MPLIRWQDIRDYGKQFKHKYDIPRCIPHKLSDLARCYL